MAKTIRFMYDLSLRTNLAYRFIMTKAIIHVINCLVIDDKEFVPHIELVADTLSRYAGLPGCSDFFSSPQIADNIWYFMDPEHKYSASVQTSIARLVQTIAMTPESADLVSSRYGKEIKDSIASFQATDDV